MSKSWLYGAATVVLAHILWFALILTQAQIDWVMPAIVAMLFIMINIAGIAAFITALKAPRAPMPLALSMAPLTALLATAGNLLLVVTGTHLDFAGARGNVGLFLVALAYGLFVSAIGGGIGIWMARRRIADGAVVATEPVPPAAEALPAAPPPAEQSAVELPPVDSAPPAAPLPANNPPPQP